ncbi:MAG TPA: transglutaminase family protein [Methanospirillum sp.]|nr:transglutaminase family protein [Methanospirillum sp.]
MPLPPLIPPVSVTPYLASSALISCTHEVIRKCARENTSTTLDETNQIGGLYRFVRDKIAHSGDIGQTSLVWKAHRVVTAGHALCFGKSHLLTALCRAVGIPAGLCYQRVKRSDGTYVLHGLTAIWLEDEGRWIRLDARGNIPGIAAEFNPSGPEQIAYPDMKDPGEWLAPQIYADPWEEIIRTYEHAENVIRFIEATASIQIPEQPISRVMPIPAAQG